MGQITSFGNLLLADEKTSSEPFVSQSSAQGGFRRIKNAHRMVAELREGDGVDPRNERRDRHRTRSENKPDHAADRLASQISRCAHGNLTVGILADFEVHRVSHNRGNHFTIELFATDASLLFDLREMQLAATAMLPKLRNELAREIHRKKVPTLSIRVLPANNSKVGPHECPQREDSDWQ